MISRMREYFRGLKLILLLVVAAFITTSVVYFGANSRDGRVGDRRVAATVNGEDIPMERYRRAYANYMEFYRQVYRERLTPEVAERLGLATQVVNTASSSRASPGPLPSNSTRSGS